MTHYPKQAATAARHPDHDVHQQFIERWSSRAFDPGSPIEEVTFFSILEAARWAPSGSNLQPWRFIYGFHGTPEFDKMLELLVPFNQSWAKNAGALIFVTSVTTYGERPIPTHSFDAGAAWMSIALQAYKLGIIAHAMGGVEFDKAPEALNLPEQLKLECAIALGYPGPVSLLPEHLQSRDHPSNRLPLPEIAFKGAFHGPLVKPA